MILVTGGTGMLGSHLLFKLLKEGEKVRALKRNSSNLEHVKKVFSYYEEDYAELFKKIEWFDADIMDQESLYESLDGIDRVFHVAALVSFRSRDKYKMISNNVTGTANIVNAALESGVQKFCHVSSISALGHDSSTNLTHEETFRNPKARYSGYSISKYRSELEVWRGITEGLNAVIVNPSIILGPGDWKTGSPSIFSNIAKGLKFYTNGITGYVDVWDVVNAMVSLMKTEISGERYIVSAENISFKEIFSKVADSLGVKRPTIHANKAMLGIAWRFEAIRSHITGNQPMVTKDSAYSANNIVRFSSQKLIDAIDFRFTPIESSVKKISEIYLSDEKIKKN
jgi:dihydroflavonol-4-reductase